MRPRRTKESAQTAQTALAILEELLDKLSIKAAAERDSMTVDPEDVQNAMRLLTADLEDDE